MNFKWRGFQRDEHAGAQSDRGHPLLDSTLPPAAPSQADDCDCDFTLATASGAVLPTTSIPSHKTLAGAGHGDLYAPDFQVASEHPPVSQSLLISRDIEALLKEDERRRNAEGRSASSSMDYTPFDDSGVPIIGLPAPPRGPRKSLPRDRRQPSRSRVEGAFARTTEQSVQDNTKMQRAGLQVQLADNNDDTLVSLSAFGPANALRAPAIGDLAIDNNSPLEQEVMNALNSKQHTDTSGKSRPSQICLSALRTVLHDREVPFVESRPSNFAEEDSKNDRLDSQANNNPEQVVSTSERTSLTGRAPAAQSSPSVFDATKLQTTRSFLTHAHTGSRDSDFSHSTYSSLDPPSTAYEPRISISSTIYPSSACDSLPPPLPASTHREDEFCEGRPSMADSSGRPSIAIETRTQSELQSQALRLHHASATGPKSVLNPTFPIPSRPNSETLPTPRFADREDVSSTDNSPIDFGAGSLLHREQERERKRERSAGTPKASGSPLLLGKPSLPTTVKPTFRRSRSVQPVSKTPRIPKPPSPTASPKLATLIPYNLLTSLSNVEQSSNSDDALPPTTNNLNPQERAELVRKTRKLTQLFGRTPSPITGGVEELPDSPVPPNNCLLPMVISTRKAHTRGALSTSDALQVATLVRGIRERHPSPLTPGGGRKSTHDSPLSPMTFRSSFLANDDSDSEGSLSPLESPPAQTPESSQRKTADGSSMTSPAIITAADSFMDLAGPEQEGVPRSPSTFSMADSLTDLQKSEIERRRKRERLAKLHRFLGSRIPPELILGPHEMGVPLPAPAPRKAGLDDIQSDNEASSPARLWTRSKRRNSLASSDPTHWLADSERMKEDLNDKEKAIIVKRALKMEKMFGEQPPQKLFHTRQAVANAGQSVPSRAIEFSSSAPTSPVGRNINKSAYRKGKSSKHNSGRPGTAESRKGLIGSTDFADMSPGKEEKSQVYLHYRHSLISLTNIVDNDDRRSLAELHEYINGDAARAADRRQKQRNSIDKEARSSLHSERRRSLPHQSSFSSLASQYTLAETKPEASPFEVRRKRAAKLSHFFGVSYRDLFGEVLDSIEMGVREDEVKGTLNPDEAQDLLAQLKKLKRRRDDFI